MYKVKQQVGFPHRQSLLDCMTADIDADCECTGVIEGLTKLVIVGSN